jgi:hypothetical protein
MPFDALDLQKTVDVIRRADSGLYCAEIRYRLSPHTQCPLTGANRREIRRAIEALTPGSGPVRANRQHAYLNQCSIALTSFNEEGIFPNGGEAERVIMAYATPNLFGLLGVKPILGRVSFSTEMHDHDQTVVIGESFCNTHFHRDPNILGQTNGTDWRGVARK